MLAAIAAADITPPVGTPLQGHYSPHPESRGILGPLEIRAVIFRSGSTTLTLITVDLTGVTLDFTQRLRAAISQRHGIEANHILIAASHTHCGPATRAGLGITPQPGILEHIQRAMIHSVDEALANLEPVTVGIGQSAAHFNINRRPSPGQAEMTANSAGVVDRRVRVLRIDRQSGSLLAVLFHYSCHPTTKYGSDGLVSPDYPGFARARIEQEMGCRAAFLPGCCGNIRPNIVSPEGKFVSASPEQLTAVGKKLADAVMTATRCTQTMPDERLGAAEMEVFFPFGPMLPAEEIEKMSQRSDQPVRADWAKRHLQRARQGKDREGENSIMQAMRIGPIALIGIPGEPVQEIGYKIERMAVGKASDVWPMGYANDKIGYFCTPQMYAEGGYETTAYIAYDRPAPFHSEEQIIAEHAAKLIDAVSA